jgi:hypothetical protein
MKIDLIRVAVVLAYAAGLAACGSTESQRADPARSGSSTPRSSTVKSQTNCPTDAEGAGTAGRHLGDSTPESEDPSRNPCWPN